MSSSEVVNYGASPVDIPFGIRFAADFADIFEVRGITRKRRGERLEDIVAGILSSFRTGGSMMLSGVLISSDPLDQRESPLRTFSSTPTLSPEHRSRLI